MVTSGVEDEIELAARLAAALAKHFESKRRHFLSCFYFYFCFCLVFWHVCVSFRVACGLSVMTGLYKFTGHVQS